MQCHHAKWLLLAVWIVSFFMAVAPLTFLGEYKHNAKSTNCRPVGQDYVLLLSVVCFLFPFITMTYCYMRVYFKVRRQRIQLQTWTSNSANMKAELKTAKIVFTVLTVFLICWLPFVTVYILSSSGKAQDVSPVIFLASGCLTAAHSVCNPVIYFTMNTAFRNDLKAWFCGIRDCLLTRKSMTYGKTSSDNCVTKLEKQNLPPTVN